MVITGDFNHAASNNILNNFHQYVDCPTRDNKTLDLLYANAGEAYIATALPPLGRSDHNLVMLTPKYVPLVKRQPLHTRTVRRWSQESAVALQDCFELTDWGVLYEPHGFCEDTVVPTRTMRCFPNNKPWITSDLKALLNKKKRAFRTGDREELRKVQCEVRDMLRICKDSYRRKLEAKLQQNNVRDVWRGMKTITGMNGGVRQTSGGMDRANQLNQFFNRFSSPPATMSTPPTPHTLTLPQTTQSSPQLSPAHLSSPPSTTEGIRNPHLMESPQTPHTLTMSPMALPPPQESPSHLSSPSSSTIGNVNPHVMVTTGQVRRQLMRLHQRKAAGPDGITPRLLKTCANQLSPVLGYLFNLSLMLERVPLPWKTSHLVPIPKKSRPSEPADYRPVALTSHRLVLAQVRPQVEVFLDPLQFAYQPLLGVDDAVTYLLQRAHMHLDGGGDTVRMTFFDFSSAFNTIKPLLMGEKLRGMGVNGGLITWVIDYLTGRPQVVRLGSVLSDMVVSDVGALQGTVLSPFLFTLYTTDFQYNFESCHLQKFSDDSAVVGCIGGGEEGEYRTLVDNCVEWSECNHLRLNVSKTRGMVIDFRRKKLPSQPVRIRGEVVEEVEDYKYLGVVIGNRLDWKANSEAVYKKGMSRLYFLRKLRSFNVCSKMLELFYQSAVASTIFFAVVCWGSSIRASDSNRLNKIIRKAGSVLGFKLVSLESVMERRMLNKLLTIMDNDQHPLYQTVDRQRSIFSHRLLQLRCRRDRYRKSFLPHAITLFNNSNKLRSYT
ncbi:RNA-directed DNA polymerase from mobile element jockey [Merluccius polli]|uniref:RNA-directed DNA polymerase from mobile element jockey n=1 Tax=Merluccius polli TaxID=89951 RepID=A0AA47M846_MERPO|nr:RNA-directed DNA polymerase from mobile element jockey [Merluccius polli]